MCDLFSLWKDFCWSLQILALDLLCYIHFLPDYISWMGTAVFATGRRRRSSTWWLSPGNIASTFWSKCKSVLIIFLCYLMLASNQDLKKESRFYWYHHTPESLQDLCFSVSNILSIDMLLHFIRIFSISMEKHNPVYALKSKYCKSSLICFIATFCLLPCTWNWKPLLGTPNTVITPNL